MKTQLSRFTFVAIVIAAAFLLFAGFPCYGQTTKPIDLDSIFVPKGPGTFDLQRGQTYVLNKSKSLRSRTWRAVGDGADPVIIFNGGRDEGALTVAKGDSATVSNIVLQGAPWTFAFKANVGGSLSVVNVKIKGGAGLFIGQGAARVGFINCTQLEPSYNYIIYNGPMTHLAPFGLAYWQDRAGPFSLTNCILDKGSLYVAGCRCVGFTTVNITNSRISDTPAQSAPGAIANAVGRFHDGDSVTVTNTTFLGYFTLGPFDAHKDGGDTLPDGPQKRFVAAERLKIATFNSVTINAPEFTLCSGVDQATFNNSVVTSQAGAVVTAHDSYLGRPISNLEFVNCKLASRDGWLGGGPGKLGVTQSGSTLSKNP